MSEQIQLSAEEQEALNDRFFSAIILEDLPKAKSLLEEGADLNARTPKGANALGVALSRNNKKAFAWLLHIGIDPNAQDNFGETVLMTLAKDGKIEYLRHILQNKNLDVNIGNNIGVTALHYAGMYAKNEAKSSQSECALLLIDAGAKVDALTIQKTTPLLTAAQNNSFPMFEALIGKGASVHDLDSYKKDILINAVSTPSQTMKEAEVESLQKIVGLAIEKGANVSYEAPGGMTPIFAAMMYGQKAIVKQLLEAGANPDVHHNIMATDHITPLHLAFEMGDAETASLILDKVVNPAQKEKMMNVKNSEGNTPGAFGFFHASTRQLTLDSGADVNATLKAGGQRYPVIVPIIQSSDETTFDAMVTRGVKLHFTDPEFETIQPIRLAIAVGLPGMVEKVIKYAKINLNDAFKVNEKKSVTPLAFLVANSQAQILESFLAQKQMIQSLLNQKLGDGSNAYRLPEEKRQELQAELDKYKNIETELKQNKEVIFDMLLKNGADINHKDPEGKSALFYVADIEYVDMLLNRGADFFQSDDEGNNPLSWSIKMARTDLIDKYLQYVIDNDYIDRPEIQNILIDMAYTGPEGYQSQTLFMKGLNHAIQEGSGLLNNTDEDGNTALIIAAATEQAAVASLLVSKGADVNMTNNSGETALMHAVAHGYSDLVKYLLEKGADVNATTQEGKSVADFAKEVQSREITELITKKIESSSRRKAAP